MSKSWNINVLNSCKKYFGWFLFCPNSIKNHTDSHRVVGVGRDLCGTPSPTLLPKQGHLQQAAEDLVQAGLEYLQRRRLHNLPGQPGPGLHHPQREVLPHVWNCEQLMKRRKRGREKGRLGVFSEGKPVLYLSGDHSSRCWNFLPSLSSFCYYFSS